MNHILIKIIFLLLVGNLQAQTTIGLTQHDVGSSDDGYVLFAPISSTTTYLIDKCGKQVKTWSSTYRPGQSCYMLPDGTLLRTGNANNTTFNAGGKGGIIQKINWAGNVTWTYTISSALECQHHDIKALPNGNILAIVWESKTNTEAISLGRNPSLTTATVWSEKIIEIQPVGTTGGNIVWEWHLWDHLVQDYDNTKPNYRTVSSSPQLFNINFAASANTTTGTDWIHMNSIDYNESLDQILLSSHAFEEVWIIDHSTTTAQAASHSGGKSGKGGDVLYRWGNPRAYNNGVVADQKIFGQHNAYWIESGMPYENQIMVFNNGNGRTGGNYSTVEIINPPVNGSNYTPTSPYLPAKASWMYNAGNPNNFYATNVSGAQQLQNGNVLICNGPIGTFTEVDANGSIVWKYVSPINNTGIMTQGATPVQNLVFRSSFYPTTFSGFSGRALVSGNTIESTNSVSASCNLTTDVDENKISENTHLYPNPVQDVLTITSNFISNSYTISDLGGKALIVSSTNSIDVSKLSSGIYLCKIITQTGEIYIQKFLKK